MADDQFAFIGDPDQYIVRMHSGYYGSIRDPHNPRLKIYHADKKAFENRIRANSQASQKREAQKDAAAEQNIARFNALADREGQLKIKREAMAAAPKRGKLETAETARPWDLWRHEDGMGMGGIVRPDFELERLLEDIEQKSDVPNNIGMKIPQEYAARHEMDYMGGPQSDGSNAAMADGMPNADRDELNRLRKLKRLDELEKKAAGSSPEVNATTISKPSHMSQEQFNTALMNVGSMDIPKTEPTGVYKDIKTPTEAAMEQASVAATMAGHGASFGMSDEAAGVDAVLNQNPVTRFLNRSLDSPQLRGIKMGTGLAMDVTAQRAADRANRTIEGQINPREASDFLPETFTQARDERRELIDEAREDYPVTSFASEMAGGAAIPAATWKQGAGLLANAWRQGLVGSILGGTYGFSEVDEDRVEGAKLGAAFGGVAGTGLPIVGTGAKQLALPVFRGGKGVTALGVEKLQKLLGREPTALDAHNLEVAVAAVKRSADRSGLTVEEIFQKVDQFQDKPAVLADVLGQDAVNALTALTRKPGSSAQKAQALVEQRFAEYPQRLAQDIETTTGLKPEQFTGDIETDVGAQMAAARSRSGSGL